MDKFTFMTGIAVTLGVLFTYTGKGDAAAGVAVLYGLFMVGGGVAWLINKADE